MQDKWVVPVCFALTILAVVCYLAPGADDGKSSDPKAKEITVKVKSLSFSPKKVEIQVGESVVWTSEARTKHSATSDDDGKTFDTGDIEPGEIVEGRQVREGRGIQVSLQGARQDHERHGRRQGESRNKHFPFREVEGWQWQRQ